MATFSTKNPLFFFSRCIICWIMTTPSTNSMEHMSKKPFEGEATVWWNLSSHVNCGWRPAADRPLTPQQYRWSLQVLKVDCASCELGVVRAIVVLCNHRRLLWRKASQLSSLKADSVTNLWLLQRTNTTDSITESQSTNAVECLFNDRKDYSHL